MLNKRSVLFILSGITLLGAWLRFYHIDFQSLWIEELYPMRVNDPANHILTVLDIARHDGNQAFSMLLYYTFNIFSYNESIARIICAIMGVLAIPATYFLVREFDKPETGLFASFLITINYWHISYSQELNVFSMAFLFATLSYLFFIRAYKYTLENDFAGYVVCTIILLNTTSFGFIIVFSQIISTILLIRINKPDKKFLQGMVIGLVTIAIFASWSSAIINNIFIGYAWMPHPKVYFILAYFHNYFGKSLLVTLILACLSAWFAVTVVRGIKRESKLDPLHLVLILWLVLSYLIPFVKSLFGNSILDIRSTIIILPAWIALISIGWWKIENLKWKIALIVIITFASLINLIFENDYYTKTQKQQIREVSQVVKEKNKSSYPIYSRNAWEFNYYFRNNPEKATSFDSLNNKNNDVTQFWLVNVGSPTDELANLPAGFEVIDKYPYYDASAFLMKKKE